MSNSFKLFFIYGYFCVIYIGLWLGLLVSYSYKYSFPILFAFNFLVFLKIYSLIKLNNNFLKILKIFLSMLFFAVFMVYFLFFERFFMNVFLFGIDGYGFLGRNGYIDYRFADLPLSKRLFWDFWSSSYYPIYIFIFIKPFVNYIDKLIKPAKE